LKAGTLGIFSAEEAKGTALAKDKKKIEAPIANYFLNCSCLYCIVYLKFLSKTNSSW